MIDLSLSLYIYIYIHIHMISLSLYIYIYIYIYVYIHKGLAGRGLRRLDSRAAERSSFLPYLVDYTANFQTKNL